MGVLVSEGKYHFAPTSLLYRKMEIPLFIPLPVLETVDIFPFLTMYCNVSIATIVMQTHVWYTFARNNI